MQKKMHNNFKDKKKTIKGDHTQSENILKSRGLLPRVRGHSSSSSFSHWDLLYVSSNSPPICPPSETFFRQQERVLRKQEDRGLHCIELIAHAHKQEYTKIDGGWV